MSPSAPNPLLIPELFQCILDYFPVTLDNGLQDFADQDTLAALARTCHALSEPSLDRLWRDLDTLYPLIRCFTPSSKVLAFDPDEEGYELDDLDDIDCPTPGEWDIIKRYAHRVRELTIEKDPLSLRFLKSIGPQASPLFPNLEYLTWDPFEIQLRGCIDLIYPLLTHTLLELQVSLTDADGERLHSFLRSYHVQCPNLEVIVFDFDPDVEVSEATTYELSRAVCSHKRLESLEVNDAPIDATALKSLAMSPLLRNLTIDHTPFGQTTQQYFRPEEIPFRHVDTLDLTTSGLDFVLSFLRPRHQIFSSLCLDLCDRPTAEAATAFFSVLASRSDVNSLEVLRLDFILPPTPDAPRSELESHCLSYQSFHPLRSFACLQELVIDWNGNISLDDNELAELASNWPSLDVFALNRRRSVRPLPTKSLTLKGLLMLSCSCPLLTDICLPVDATKIPTDAFPDFRNTSVVNLDFPESRTHRPASVAAFLFKHFPCLTSVQGEYRHRPRGTYLPTYQHLWTAVNSALLRLRSPIPAE